MSTYIFLDVLSLPITRAYEKVALSTEVGFYSKMNRRGTSY